MKEPTSLQHWTESYRFWSKAITRKNGYPSMHHYNIARRLLAREIRNTERKLNRPHRHLPKLGAVQYMGNVK